MPREPPGCSGFLAKPLHSEGALDPVDVKDNIVVFAKLAA